MTFPVLDLATIRRPKLLLTAARFGAADYRRSRDLRRIFGGTAPSAATVLDRLVEEEAELEARRRSGDATYPVARHVDVMIALIAEARLLPPREGDAVT